MQVVALGRPNIDLTLPDKIDAAVASVSPDLVINAAAYTAVDQAESEPELAALVNSAGPGWLAEACAKRSLPLIHLSTDYVYDGTKLTPYKEDDPVEPLGIYGRTKLEGEQRVTATNPRHVILRSSWIYSPYGHNFVKTMLRLAESRSELNVVNDQLGSPTYAPHLAEAIVAIVTHLADSNSNDALWGTYHAAGRGEASWFDLAVEVFRCSRELGGPRATTHAITTADYPTPAARPANSRLNCAKLEKTFGITLPNWRLGVADCVRELIVSN